MMSAPLAAPIVNTPAADRSPQTCRAIVLDVAGLKFALPYETVVRVLDARGGDRLNVNGLALLQDTPLTLLKLHQLVRNYQAQTGMQIADREIPAQFWAIIQSRNTQPCAMLVDAPPSLKDIALQTVRTLPPLHREALGQVATTVAIVSEGDRPQILFLLHLEMAMNRARS